MDSGKKQRYEILKNKIEANLVPLLNNHDWQVNINSEYFSGEYILLDIQKADITKSIAILYSCATDNKIYKKLDKEVDLILLNGRFYHLESYAYGISTPVEENLKILKYLKNWNSLCCQDVDSSLMESTKEDEFINNFIYRIQSENPIEQIWLRIKQFKSQEVALTLIKHRARENNIDIDDDILMEKAKGAAFCIQNASEYFEVITGQSLSKKIINLYYGCISLASAEMLMDPSSKYKSLDEIEDATKYGHGLFTHDSLIENTFEGFIVGAKQNGFFSKWVKFLGFNTKDFTKNNPKSDEDINFNDRGTSTLIELISHIPELQDILKSTSNKSCDYLKIYPDKLLNGSNDDNKDSVYVKIIDISKKKTAKDIDKLSPAIEQVEYSGFEDGSHCFRALINRKKEYDVNLELIRQYKSPYVGTVILTPIFEEITNYRVTACAILYSLSILVRYRPSIWREIESGKYFKYSILIEEMILVFERMLPEEFLQSILDKEILVTTTGSLLSQG